MSNTNNYDYNRNDKISRQIEEIVESIDENIIRCLDEDEALISQAYNSETEKTFCEKYREFADELLKVRNELMYQIECRDKHNKHKFMS